MATDHKRNRFVTFYHSLVAILILLAGGALLGLGAWLRTTDNGLPLNLEYGDKDSPIRGLQNFDNGALILGGFLLLTGVTALLAMSRKCVGVTFRVIYVILALTIAAGLGLTCWVATTVVRRGDQAEVRDFLSDAWKLTVTQKPAEVCTIEKEFECRGFRNNDCDECPTGSEAACSAKPFCARCGAGANATTGCYDKIIENAVNIFRPVAIISGIVGAIVLLDAFVSCCL